MKGMSRMKQISSLLNGESRSGGWRRGRDDINPYLLCT